LHTVQDVLGVNQGLRIGVGDLGRIKSPPGRGPTVIQGQGYRIFGFKVAAGRLVPAPKLGDTPVLAEGTAEVTARETKGEDRGTGAKVIEGFFLDRVTGKGGYKTVPGNMAFPVQISPHAAGPPALGGDQAMAGTEIAAEYIQF
jgi:hypothetical protein